MVPTDERFDARRQIGFGVDDGLVKNVNLASFERIAKVFFKHALVFGRLQQVT